MEEIKKILQKTLLFENVTEKIIEECLLNRDYTLKEFDSNEILQDYRSSKRIGILCEGNAVIVSGNDGAILKKISSGELFGLALLYDENPSYLTKVLSHSRCKVLFLSKDFVDNAMAICPKIAQNYIRLLSKKIGFLNNKISAFTEKTTEGKLYTYLLQVSNGEKTFVLTTDYSQIAKLLGIGRASLYRSFEKLEKERKIIKEDKKITIVGG